MAASYTTPGGTTAHPFRYALPNFPSAAGHEHAHSFSFPQSLARYCSREHCQLTIGDMPISLQGSCRCGQVRFSADSHAPLPFMRCSCSICQKIAGGGGYAVNLHGDKRTMKVEGRAAVFHAKLDDGHGGCRLGTAELRFCATCASALWVFSPEYAEIFYPFASAIDRELPRPPSPAHMMLGSKASWVQPKIGKDGQRFEQLPDDSLED